MKQPIKFARLAGVAAFSVALLTGLPAQAQQEMAHVVSSTPVMQQVPVTRQVCQDEAVTRGGQKSGAGALMGGLAGGAIGNAIGKGSGNAAATALGLFGGAILGNSIEGEAPPETQMVRRCYPQTVYESHVSAYNVVYEFGGKQYSAQMPSDPGQYVQLQITPIVPRPPSGYAPAGYTRSGYPQSGYGR
ncbi:hypothetical protein [Malikia sp.]|uniref:glycine zipper 2TM domain-containing protein n=1 Tax=Malikia sp. TaxID=2070706 RepID=UPI002616AF51|nr:hypothetical protein [Malikia sp.]MDD2728691.1 hypothetical protein [Malikia sp.]